MALCIPDKVVRCYLPGRCYSKKAFLRQEKPQKSNTRVFKSTVILFNYSSVTVYEITNYTQYIAFHIQTE